MAVKSILPADNLILQWPGDTESFYLFYRNLFIILKGLSYCETPMKGKFVCTNIEKKSLVLKYWMIKRDSNGK